MILTIFLFSALFTFLSSSLIFYLEYRKEIQHLEERIKNIKNTDFDTITTGLWRFDNELLATQLKGILRIPEIKYAEIQNKKGECVISSGKRPSGRISSWQFVLHYHSQTRDAELGTLLIVADMEEIYQRLHTEYLIIFGVQALQTFLVSIFILIFVHFLIMRHLRTIAQYAQKIFDFNGLEQVLTLNRAHLKNHSIDELERVVEAINSMRLNLIKDMEAQQSIEKELIKSKEKAEESESRLRALSDNLPGGLVYQIDSGVDAQQRKFSYISAGVEQLHSITAEEVLNDPMTIYGQVLEEDLQSLAEQEIFAAANMVPLSAEVRILLPSGETRWRLFTSAPRRLPNNHLVWDGIELDITKRKEIEESLLIKSYALSSSINGIAISNMEGYLIYINPSFLSMWGFNNDAEVIGKHVTEFWQEKEKAQEIIAKLKKSSHYIGELKGKRKDGSFFDTQLSASIVKNQNGIPINMMASFLDISEQRKLENQLNNIQKLESIGILAGGIAHDFNNMLGVISGNISYVLSIIDRDNELFEILSDVQTGTKQAQKLTQQLLTFAKGGAPIKKEADLRDVLKESALFVTRGSKVRCEFIFAEDLWTVAVDTGQMNQAISNLVINSTQAMPEGGIIQIKAENKKIIYENNILLSPGCYVKISIKDNGIGIPEKHISKIFDPYFTTKQKGSGLGLATTYSIIQGHNGNISVESNIGEGTVFYIYLPATDTKPIIEQKKQSVEIKGHGKILLMDDQEMILNMTGRLFGHMGYKTFFAKDGKQAIQMYKEAFLSQQPFDLVVLDLTIPGGMGGAETITELLKINPKVKAVVSSGYSNDPIMANYQDYGFCGVITKPFTKSEITETLSQILGKNDV
ncbi:MAG: PAS domain S-box protein [Desulfobacterales bacterium]|nr:PAS domain S-box protein [Desulfobacterales bacterium]